MVKKTAEILKHSAKKSMLMALVSLSVMVFNNAEAACNNFAGSTDGCSGESSPASLNNTSGTNQGAGNPINVMTGNKYQKEVDMPALPGELGIEVVRHYNSSIHALGHVGYGWRLSYETELHKVGKTIQITEADGSRIIFARDEANPTSCTSSNPENGRIEIKKTAKGEEYTWFWQNGRRLNFNHQGKLERITSNTGAAVKLLYGPKGALLKVTDPQGRSLHIEYAPVKSKGFKGIVAIKTPVGRFVYQHQNDKNKLGISNLISVHYPDSKSVNNSSTKVVRYYHYGEAEYTAKIDPSTTIGIKERSHLLTGISIEWQDFKGKKNQKRINTWAYDAHGRGVLSVKGLAQPLTEKSKTEALVKPAQLSGYSHLEEVKLQYEKQASSHTHQHKQPHQHEDSIIKTTVLTNSAGKKTTYTHTVIAGQFRLLKVQGAGCSSCGEANVEYEYDKFARLTGVTKLDTAGKRLYTQYTERDDLGRTKQTVVVRYQNNHAMPAQLVQRFEYPSRHLKASFLNNFPILIARPSVAHGKERQWHITYNDYGQPLEIREVGYRPVFSNKVMVSTSQEQPFLNGAQHFEKISRTIKYKYQFIHKKSLLVSADGPLPNGKTQSSKDSDITTYQYDKRGRYLIKITYPLGLTAYYKYDTNGANHSGRLISVTGIDGIVSEFDYHYSGAINQLSRAGTVTKYKQDAMGRNTWVMDATGQEMNVTYDLAGNLASMFDKQNNLIKLSRSAEGALQKAELFNPDGTAAQKAISYSNNLNAQLATSVEKGNRDAVLTQLKMFINGDASNVNLAKPKLEISPYEIMQAANATQLTNQLELPNAVSQAKDSLGRTTYYWVDDFGRLLFVKSPVTGLTSFKYNKASQLVLRKNVQGAIAQYQRDAAGRVTKVVAKSATGQIDENASIVWGEANKPTTITYLSGKEQFAYTKAGKIKTHTQTVNNQTFKINYQYNQAGQLIAKTLPDGQTLSYRYRGSVHPKAGLLASIWLNGIDRASLHQLSGGMLDRPIIEGLNSAKETFKQRAYTHGNGLTDQLVKDDAGRIVQAGNTQVGQTQLTYNQQANLSKRNRDEVDSASLQVSQQQPMSLGQQAKAQATLNWVSRVHALSTWGEDDLLKYALQPQAPPADTPILFDEIGRQTTRQNQRYIYDSLNRLVEVRSSVLSGDERIAQYQYNLFGQRISKTVYSTRINTAENKRTAPKTTYYFYDGSHLVAEQTEQDQALTQYVWMNDKPIALLKDNDLYHIHTDHRNAPLTVTDEARNLVWQAKVADYLYSSPVENNSLGSITFNIRGSNQYFDAETGLHYNTNRYYDAQAKRYITPDPLGLAVGPDLYAFALNQPHGISDPLGLAPIANESVADWSLGQKLEYVFKSAAKQFPGEVGDALLELVSPTALATTAAVFGVWAITQATPIGWAADVAILGVGYLLMGKAIYDVLRTLVETAVLINGAKCISDLGVAANVLAKGGAKGATGLAAGAGVLGVAKLAKQIKMLLKNSPIGVEKKGRQLWKNSVNFKGNKVYQRDDLIDPKLVDSRGRTNIERMQKGLAPIGPDGKSINLHHLTQSHNGAIAEMTQTFHQQNSKIIHINPNSVPSGIDRAAFNKWRADYWKSRANDF